MVWEEGVECLDEEMVSFGCGGEECVGLEK
jgi:hypothetical protein